MNFTALRRDIGVWENSQQAAALMAKNKQLVQGGNSALHDMLSSMTAIKESSDKVSKMIKTIDEIAFQTTGRRAEAGSRRQSHPLGQAGEGASPTANEAAIPLDKTGTFGNF
jgi:methyl-accepting chemotaxis protein